MKRVENKKERENLDIENHPRCPECGGKNTCLVYVNCLCCRTYEGSGRTCWEAPHCNSCSYTGAGNSDGGLWYMPDGW